MQDEKCDKCGTKATVFSRATGEHRVSYACNEHAGPGREWKSMTAVGALHASAQAAANVTKALFADEK